MKKSQRIAELGGVSVLNSPRARGPARRVLPDIKAPGGPRMVPVHGKRTSFANQPSWVGTGELEGFESFVAIFKRLHMS